MDEFEKRLTAVHTRGLENVESPEMDEDSQKQGGSEKGGTHTPLASKGGTRTKRGPNLSQTILCLRHFEELNNHGH